LLISGRLKKNISHGTVHYCSCESIALQLDQAKSFYLHPGPSSKSTMVTAGQAPAAMPPPLSGHRPHRLAGLPPPNLPSKPAGVGAGEGGCSNPNFSVFFISGVGAGTSTNVGTVRHRCRRERETNGRRVVASRDVAMVA
jgi:hypothetical protein